MAPLKNPRHEKVAQLRAQGEQLVDAHEKVFGKRNKQAASLLFKRADIQARVAEIQASRIQTEIDTTEHALQQLGITKMWWLGKLKANAEMCALGTTRLDRKGNSVSIPDVHGFNKSMELIGRAMGVYIDKLEIGGPGDFQRMSDAELAAESERIAKALGLSEDAAEEIRLLTFQPEEKENDE